MSQSAQLLISVVRRGRGDRVVELVRAAGAAGSTVLIGRGTAQNRILSLLGLADTEKELVFTIAQADAMPPLVAALRAAPDLCKKVPGIGFIIDVTAFLRPGAPAALAAEEHMSFEHELICVIANAGYGDDIMQAAREAGARGGTILKARGTGSREDGKFFGITIVPEKEMVMILSKKDAAAPIVEAIRTSSCLAQPGMGIVFCMPVQDFFPLGAKANAR